MNNTNNPIPPNEVKGHPSTENAQALVPADDKSLMALESNGRGYAHGPSPLLLTNRPVTASPTETDLQQLLLMVSRRWKVMLVTFLTIVTVIAVYTLSIRPIYEAKAVLQVNTSNKNDSAASDLPALAGMLDFMQSRSLDTQVEILKNSVVQHGARQHLSPGQKEAVKGYDVKVMPIRNTDLIAVSATSHDPAAAQALANALCREYINRSQNRNRMQVRTASAYVSSQLNTVTTKLAQALDALQKFKEKHKTVNLQAESQEKIAQLSKVEADLRAVEAERVAVQNQLSQIRTNFSKMAPNVVVESDIGRSTTTEELKSQLTKLEIQRMEALAEYTPTSRQVRGIDEQIAQLRRRLANAETSQVRAWKPNPVREQLAQQVAQLQGQHWALQARNKALVSMAERSRTELAQLPELEHRLSLLLSNVADLEQTRRMLSEKFQTLRISEEAQLANAEVLSFADKPGSPVRPRRSLNMLAGVVAGLLLSVLLAILLDRLDDRMHTEEEVHQSTQLPVLGRVPLVTEVSQKLLGSEKNSILLESFRMLRTNISFLAIDEPIRSLVVTSTQPGEGKSLTAANLAIAAATGGERVILVDCDLRRPSLHRVLELPNKVGLSSVISGAVSLEDALQETSVPNLYVLTSGPVPPDSFALLKSRAGRATFDQIFKAADFVVVDTPPSLLMVDARIATTYADAALLVVSAQEASKRDIVLTCDLLSQTSNKLLGVTFNKIPPTGLGYYGGYGYYRYKSYSAYLDNADSANGHADAAEPGINALPEMNGKPDGKPSTDKKNKPKKG